MGEFEEIDLEEHHYDLIFSAQAFHWVDQGIRWVRCKECLKDNGSVALLYNYSILPMNGAGKEISELIGHEASDVMKTWDYETSIIKWREEMEQTKIFGSIAERRQKWLRRCTARQYRGCLSLPQADQMRIADSLVMIVEKNGGLIDHCRHAGPHPRNPDSINVFISQDGHSTYIPSLFADRGG